MNLGRAAHKCTCAGKNKVRIIGQQVATRKHPDKEGRG